MPPGRKFRKRISSPKSLSPVKFSGQVLTNVRQATNLVQAIALAGGLGPYAAKRRIQVHRGSGAEETIFHFDYKAYEAGTDAEKNIPLQAGDVIIVPERGILE